VFPINRYFERDTSLSRQSIITHLQNSTESRWLNIRKRDLKGQQWKRNDYSISLPQAVEAVKDVDDLSNEKKNIMYEGGQSDTHKVVKQVDASTSKKTSIKPTVKEDVPEWLPTDLWDAFKEHRVKLKKPLTEYAEKLIINELLSFQEKGLNSVTLLKEAIAKGWSTAYEPKIASVITVKNDYVSR
jgi:hypothetical protein